MPPSSAPPTFAGHAGASVAPAGARGPDTSEGAGATGRQRPWRWLAAVVGAVALLHLLLIQALVPAPPPAGRAEPAPSRAVLALRAPAGGPAMADPQARPDPPATPATLAETPPAPPATRPPVRLAAPEAVPAAAPNSPATAPDTPPATPLAAGPAPTQAASRATAPAAPEPGALDADPGDAADGQPPPVYPTHLPPPARWAYALRYNGQAGQARLDWQPAAGRYRLSLVGRAAGGAPLIEQTSDGLLDAAGVAPERFDDRRRGRRQQAAHFQRAAGLISFSGPQRTYPVWPGAQDRLSWLPQLAGIVAASARPLPEVQLFVADARGHGGLWRFVPQGPETLDTPQGPVEAQRWLREPPRPEGLRVEAWLDAARGHWPARLRFTALRSGDVFELELLGEAPAP